MASLSCKDFLEDRKISLFDHRHGEISANGVLVTGEQTWALSELFKNMAIDNNVIEIWAQSHALILSLGEGTSNLVPTLVQRGVNAYGLDVCYSIAIDFPNTPRGEEMKNYLILNRSRLIIGDARYLPYEAETLDVVVSHKLVNNLHIADTLDIITEILRVLKIGGEARIYGFSPAKLRIVSEFIVKNFPEEQRNFTFTNGLLIYNKQGHVAWPDKVSKGFWWDRDKAYGDGVLSGPRGLPFLGFGWR